MAFYSSEYWDTVASLQKSVHHREKRRHELEEELFAYTRSEERLAKLKCVKMRHYHRELCKREQQANARNLELLRSVESLVSKAKEFSIDYSALHNLKLECRHHLTRLAEESRWRESEEPREAPNENDLQENSTSVPQSVGRSSQSVSVITGQQAPHRRWVEDGVLSARSLSLMGPSPHHPSAPQPQVYPLTHGPVSPSSDVPDVDGPADGVAPSVGPSVGREHGSGRLASPHGTSQVSGASSHHPTVSGSSHQRHLSQSPSPDTPRSTDPTQDGGQQSGGAGAGAGAELPPKCPDISEQGQNGSPSAGRSDVALTPQSSPNSASDASLSLSDVLHEPRSPGGGAAAARRDGTPSTGGRTPADTAQPGGPLSPEPEPSLSLEGFFYLLDSIEERLPARDAQLYASPAVSEQELRDVISRVGGHGETRREELAACGAVVLQQLPRLARSGPHGCLLPSRLVHAHWSTATDAAPVRSCLFGDGALLWDRWLSHVCRLLRWEVLPLERAVRLFTPLLVCDGASYTDKAEVLLKRLLTQAADAVLSAESEESSSCSLPSLLHDGPEIRPARPSKNPATQGVQSGEEDSADQSPMESIPIRETKAYRLLKQSVAQEKRWRNRQEEDASDSEPTGVSGAEKPKTVSPVQDSREDPKRSVQGFSAVQSKAFWGDSDDTNSDIELALRPQAHGTNNGDLDDFYD
ncbi:centrosomal protein kizuna isoform X2 [Brachyhypopomus gauderio]|uniref:centrosomal protein kizuna isoform X2 n=1 Tax=Brachyhypopomus gauderio TaxID=698409 RepID=UPI0040433C17